MVVSMDTDKERDVAQETPKPKSSSQQKVDPNALVKLKLLLQGAPLVAQGGEHSRIGMVRNLLNKNSFSIYIYIYNLR